MARFSLPTCLPQTTKMHQKSMPRGTPSWTSNFDRFLIGFCFQLGPRGCQKSVFFQRKNEVFSKNRLSKITSISASILVPTCLHVALQNRRFSDFWRFQEAFKISCFFGIDFLSILAPSWPPTWGHLGSQDGSKFEKMAPTFWEVAPLFRVLIRTCF